MVKLPKLSKEQMRDEPTLLALIRSALTLATQEFEDRGAATRAYAQLKQLIEWEHKDGHPLTDLERGLREYAALGKEGPTGAKFRALLEEWQVALGAIHEKVYGYQPKYGHRPELAPQEVFPELEPAACNAALHAIHVLDEIGGGENVAMLARETYKQTKAHGISLPKKQIVRLAAYAIGAPIPPA